MIPGMSPKVCPLKMLERLEDTHCILLPSEKVAYGTNPPSLPSAMKLFSLLLSSDSGFLIAI